MSADKYRPHVLVLPEDDANRQLANGFLLEIDFRLTRSIQVLKEAGGWTKALKRFESDHIIEMDRCSKRFMVLLIDFDGKEDRLKKARAAIPTRLTERVFILGALTEPEALRRANLGSYETIGRAIARDCRKETDTILGHELLRHNASGLDRLRVRVRPILFHSI